VQQVCETCGIQFSGPRRRAYCSRACWPSEFVPPDAALNRQELVEEAAQGSIIAQLVLSKLDKMAGREEEPTRSEPVPTSLP
jgi:hypothetical protein